jgi:PEGA domain
LSCCLGLSAMPPIAMAAPPARPAPAKKPTTTKPTADDPRRAEARKRYAEAELRFQNGDYEGAFASYKAANDLIAAAQTLYKMALCLDKLDKTTDAIAAYQTFLGSNPPASLDARVSDAQGRVIDLRRKVPALIKVRSDPPSAAVALDGSAQPGTTPLDFKSPPGHHKIRVTSPGYDPYEKDLDLEGGSEVTVEATLPKSNPDVPPPPPPVADTQPMEKAQQPEPERRSNVAAYVVLGLAGAGVVVGGVFGVKALKEKSDFNGGVRTSKQADAVERDALIADMALGAALTLGVTGVVLLVTNASPSAANAEGHAHRATFEFSPVMAPRAAGAAATFHF